MTRLIVLALLAASVWSAMPAAARDGRVTLVAGAPFQKVADALEKAIADQKMAIVCHANAQCGAAARAVTIKGNQVLMVFRNDFAVRLLNADPTAGFEAPIRIYIYENSDGTATVSDVPPSVVFASYRHPEVRVVAQGDPIFRAMIEAV